MDGQDATHPDPPCFDNSNRYVDCGNGTVTDTVTGLIWLKATICLADDATYSAANQAAAGLKDGDCFGFLTDKSSPGDWRLPTKDEWSATVARAVALGCTTPSLTNDAGTGCWFADGSSSLIVGGGNYWSSTPDETIPSNAWFTNLDFGLGFNELKVLRRGVWPVRGGPR